MLLLHFFAKWSLILINVLPIYNAQTRQPKGQVSQKNTKMTKKGTELIQ